MKRHLKSSILGVTLLEIMLVLAIAAMVIVMSVRYYQSAQLSSAANATMGIVQSITAAADSMAQGTGSYASATSANIKAIAGSGALNLPWGGSAAITGAAASYSVSMAGMPTGVCTILKSKLSVNAHYTATGNTCPATGTMTFTYTYTP